jgi:hypothetical protein
MEHIKLFEEFLNQNIESINEDTLLLRKMARKSKFGFGKYNEYTVSDVLKVDKQYLKWCYYYYEMITFMDDILDEIGISEDYRIQKPGKNPDVLIISDMSKKAGFAKLSDEEKLKAIKKKSHEEKEKRIRDFNISKGNNKFYTKGYLQRKNHGKL